MDRYDEAIAYLTEHPEDIVEAWDTPLDNPGGALFMGCKRFPDLYSCCLTQVASGQADAETYELTKRIREDMRIPRFTTAAKAAEASWNDLFPIKVEHLPVFAEWHRKMDIELNREAEWAQMW
jgi:hypothetical protein